MTLVNPLDVRTVVHPRTVAEALAHLARGDVQVLPLAGGMSLLADKVAGAEVLIDLSEMGWRYVQVADGALRIGAVTPLEDLVTAAVLRSWAGGVLASAAHGIAPQVQRHQITVGGILADLTRSNELGAVLAALEARVVYYTPADRDRPREVLLTEWARRTPQEEKCLIAAVHVPEFTQTWRASLHRVGRTPRDMALLCAVVAAGEGPAGQLVRVAVGGTDMLPQRLPDVEALLEAREDWDQVEARVRASVAVPDNWRASAAYRQAMAGVLVRRAAIDVLS